MQSYVALLRGVNVSGKNRIKMPELISLLSGAGFNNSKAYLQSGNLIFGSQPENPQIIAEAIQKSILQGLGLEVAVLVKSGEEMAGIAGRNPFLKLKEIDPEFLYVTFLFENPAEDKIRLIDKIKDEQDSFKVLDTQLYLYCPGGYGRTRFSNSFFENKLGVAATTRNWRTVNALKEMASGIGLK